MNNLGKNVNDVIGSNVYWGCLLLASICCLFILLFVGVPSDYAILYSEPVVFMVFFLLFIRREMLIGLGSKLLIALYFLKLCILPITTVIGNFTSEISSDIFSPYWNEGCFFIALEWIIVAASLRLLSSEYMFRMEQEQSSYSLSTEIQTDHTFLWLIVVFLLVVCISLIVASPYLVNEFYWIWEDDTTGIVASIGGAKYYLFKTLIEIVKPMTIFSMVVIINKSNLKIGKVLITALLAFFSVAFMTEYRLLALLTGITIVVYILATIKRTVFVSICKIAVVLLGGIAVFWLVTGGESMNKTLGNLCRVLDNYCGGFITAAGACSVHMENGLEMFFHDICSGSYLIKSIYRDLSTTTDIINQALNPEAKGAFYELIIQCKDFFGIFMPFALYLIVRFVVYMDYKVAKEKDDLYSLLFLYCGLGTATTIIMYTYSMVVNFIIYKCLIWLAIIWIDKHWRGIYIIL